MIRRSGTPLTKAPCALRTHIHASSCFTRWFTEGVQHTQVQDAESLPWPWLRPTSIPSPETTNRPSPLHPSVILRKFKSTRVCVCVCVCVCVFPPLYTNSSRKNTSLTAFLGSRYVPGRSQLLGLSDGSGVPVWLGIMNFSPWPWPSHVFPVSCCHQ